MSDDIDSSIDPAEDFLAHYGVLGMKWGVRKDNQRNPNYTQNQRRRDQQVYGRRGVKRINRELNRGASISVARGDEKTRRDRVLGKNKYIRPIGKFAGGLAGGALATLTVNAASNALYSNKVLSYLTNNSLAGKLTAPLYAAIPYLKTPAGKVAVAAGGGYIGTLLGGDIAVAINTRSHGYDPRRKP